MLGSVVLDRARRLSKTLLVAVHGLCPEIALEFMKETKEIKC